MVEFQWDPRKNRANLRKHHIGFEAAKRIFDGPYLEKIDDDSSMTRSV